jgi:hypothetical protein
VLRRDHHVTTDHHLEPARQRRAVRRGDERFRERSLGETTESLLGDRELARGEGLEVHARGERLVARGGQHDDPDVGVGLTVVQRGAQRHRRGAVDRVASLGSVDGEHFDVPTSFAKDFVCHQLSSLPPRRAPVRR